MRVPLLAVCLGLAIVGCARASTTISSLSSWRLQSAAVAQVGGQQASTAGYDDSSWYPVSVPCTVFACLLQNGVYEEPFYGINLQSISSEPFNSSTWWYRTEFTIPDDAVDYNVDILFKGINYRANVWFNGVLIGNEEDIVGTFRWFSFDITSMLLTSGVSNALALEIYKPYDVSLGASDATDLAISFVDWSPEPPDSNMGLWQEVLLRYTAASVSIAYPQVSAVVAEDASTADVSVLLELYNYATTSVSGVLSITMPKVDTITKSVTVPPRSSIQVLFDPATFPSLSIEEPDLWWPWQMGAQNMQTLTASFTIGVLVSDTISAQFGLRQVTSELSDGHRLFKVNGKPILLRGGGFTPDLFQRSSPQRQETEMMYMRDMNMNTIRLEGKFENDNFYTLADKYGMLIMPGWCCCDAWQHWSLWSDEEHYVAAESTRSQVKRLRIHPSVFVFLYGSDEAPPLDVESEYLEVFQEEQWSVPTLASAAATTSDLTGSTGVKMSGPYSWVPPNYWLTDPGFWGGGYGLLTEGGPGEAPLTYESLIRMLPSDHWWPVDSWWDYHTAPGVIKDFRYFSPPLNARYGEPQNAVDFSYTSQVANYEAMRSMFEGYSRNKYTSTGVIQWMQNNPWFSNKWHMYDYFLVQGGGYFGSKKACEPLHIMYAYDDNSVYAINSLYSDVTSMKAYMDLILLNGTVVSHDTASVPLVPADGKSQVFPSVPKPSSADGVYFLHLTLYGVDDGILSDNMYWLSTQADVLSWKESNYYRTPCSQYADFTALRTLPQIDLTVTSSTSINGDTASTSVKITNPSPSVAFFVRVRLQCQSVDIVPSFWTDNYVTIMPTESAVLVGTYKTSQIQSCGTPSVLVESFNNNAR
ncbi:glycosyl hydrolase family 2 [Pelomyxa schiedti]|nr:glycosyl hydrolase family 2 [Pelomyxa schiedti]